MGVRDGKGEMLTVSSGGDVFWSRQACHVVITHPTGGSREAREGVGLVYSLTAHVCACA